MKLYILPTCPYCLRVLHYISENNILLDTVEVPSSHPLRTELKELTGQTYVPTLIDGDTIIANDDDAIIEYLGTKIQTQPV